MACNVSMISTYVAPVVAPMTTEEFDMEGRTLTEHIHALVVEMRVLTSVINEGLNTKENLDDLREDEDKELNI